eukprot:m.65378 g.65378  ORF g.65378 m.65378 type:complete len:1181 (-) comp23554_c0_seq1:213-3755(-)
MYPLSSTVQTLSLEKMTVATLFLIICALDVVSHVAAIDVDENCNMVHATSDACLQCANAKFLHDGVCINTCPSDTTPINSDDTFGRFCAEACGGKTGNCHACNEDQTECLQCRFERYLHEGQCVEECPKGYEGTGTGLYNRECEAVCVPNNAPSCGPLDLMFLLDSSGSLNIPRLGGVLRSFQDKVLLFADMVAASFRIGNEATSTRVGVASFSGMAQAHFTLDSFTSVCDMHEGLASIPYPGGPTRTSLGLEAVLNDLMNESKGLRALDETLARVLIVVTDGRATEGFEPAQKAELLREQGVVIVVIAIGLPADDAEMVSMATSPRHVFSVPATADIFDVVGDTIDACVAATLEAIPTTSPTPALLTLSPTMALPTLSPTSPPSNSPNTFTPTHSPTLPPASSPTMMPTSFPTTDPPTKSPTMVCSPKTNGCHSCNVGLSACTKCRFEQYLLEGQCIVECPEGYEGVGTGKYNRFCREVCVPTISPQCGPLDLMFLLDTSGSWNIPKFGGVVGSFQNNVLGFTEKVTSNFYIGRSSESTRVAIATFSETAKVHFHLGGHENKCQMERTIHNDIPYPGGATHTSVGFDTVLHEFMSQANGLRPLAETQARVLLVVIDGESVQGYEPAQQAEALRDQGVVIVVVAVGIDANSAEVVSMASSPDHIFTVASADDLVHIIPAVVNTVCDIETKAPTSAPTSSASVAPSTSPTMRTYRKSCSNGRWVGHSIRLTDVTSTNEVSVKYPFGSQLPMCPNLDSSVIRGVGTFDCGPLGDQYRCDHWNLTLGCDNSHRKRDVCEQLCDLIPRCAGFTVDSSVTGTDRCILMSSTIALKPSCLYNSGSQIDMPEASCSASMFNDVNQIGCSVCETNSKVQFTSLTFKWISNNNDTAATFLFARNAVVENDGFVSNGGSVVVAAELHDGTLPKFLALAVEESTIRIFDLRCGFPITIGDEITFDDNSSSLILTGFTTTEGENQRDLKCGYISRRPLKYQSLVAKCSGGIVIDSSDSAAEESGKTGGIKPVIVIIACVCGTLAVVGVIIAIQRKSVNRNRLEKANPDEDGDDAWGNSKLDSKLSTSLNSVTQSTYEYEPSKDLEAIGVLARQVAQGSSTNPPPLSPRNPASPRTSDVSEIYGSNNTLNSVASPTTGASRPRFEDLPDLQEDDEEYRPSAGVDDEIVDEYFE